MKMSAFRFAKLHNINLGRVEYWEDKDYELFCGISRGSSSGYCIASIRYSYDMQTFADTDSRIAFSKSPSQREKNLCVWHEIGHWLDFRQNFDKIQSLPIVVQEYRAWVKAIKLMKKYKQWDSKFLVVVERCLKSYILRYGSDIDYISKLKKLGECR